MGVWIVLAIGWIAGWMLFRRVVLPRQEASYCGGEKVSVIIPARNEAGNLPQLLGSLQQQTCPPHEIIVVDDFSEDETYDIATSYGVHVIQNEPLPPGWTGKTWAVWNGYRQSTGDVIAFLDADVRLAPRGLESLLRARAEAGGVISAVPFHVTEKFYERLALITNVLGVFAFTSPFERNSPNKGLYGSCIVTTRRDYETIQGHDSIRSELLDDLNLGAKFRAAGIPVSNFLGGGLVSFRMYPNGIRSELEGFGKGAVLSTAKLRPATTLLVAAWLIGLIASEGALFLWNTSWLYPVLIGYLLYAAQLYFLVRDVGKFGKFMPLIHVLSTLFFLVVLIYSAYQVTFRGSVTWKGRDVQVGSRGDR
ncbi:glycosyltransferase [Paenibacillus sp. DXFW5]|uniref:4,4'-diaponeurosporenoate glycosyltransferase n=1 Tax=Paenibacillus rhizolycopersici TaxID=2780073 RepID=A0ABS2H9Y1_9BACL|nr:glycosyltransferase [Paenibacillus rhizolycopersici]MBM6996839.1 glycosyltransferase [Paenibacillus rhizolycopersici]